MSVHVSILCSVASMSRSASGGDGRRRRRRRKGRSLAWTVCGIRARKSLLFRAQPHGKNMNQWVSKKGKKKSLTAHVLLIRTRRRRFSHCYFNTFGIGLLFDKVVFFVRDIHLRTIQNIISSSLKPCRSTLWHDLPKRKNILQTLPRAAHYFWKASCPQKSV